MATQLADAPDSGADDHNDNAIDFEAAARKMGWSPADEFKGDPSKHIDAETFVKRGEEILPILKARLKGLEKRLEQSDKSARQASEFFAKAEERAYQRAREDLKREMADAVESGDTKAADAVMDKLDKLEKPTSDKPADIDPDKRAEEFADWGKNNKWYADNEVMRLYADAQADKLAKAKGGVLEREDLDEVSNRVKAKFEDAYPELFNAAAKPKPRNPVDGGGSAPARRGGRTFADLPADAQRVCDKWVANGTIKDRDTYVKSYDFGDKK